MHSTLFKRVSFLLSAVLVLSAPHVASADTPKLPENEESWYVVKMQGQSCGYMNSLTRRVGDEIHSDNTIKIEIKRGAAVVSITQEQHFRETLDGKPLAFKHVSKMGNVPETVTGEIDGEKVHVTTSQFNAKHQDTFPFDPEIRFAWGQILEQSKYGMDPGTKFSLKTYEPSLKKNGPIVLDFEVIGWEQVDILGKQRRLCKVKTSMRLQGADGEMAQGIGDMSIDSEIWVDESHTPVRINTDVGIMKMDMYQTTREDALKKGAPPEMFLETFVYTNREIGNKAKQVKLRLKLKDGAEGPLPDLPNTSMQSFEKVNDREGILTIKRLDWDAIDKVKDNGDVPSEVQSYLEASAVCDSKDRKIRRLARKAVRGLDTPSEKADALRKVVTKHIKDKNMDIGFATASEVVRERAGDCSEHGVLLAAVARAAGLPARGVTGIVEVPSQYFGGTNKSAFGYHMWTQVWIGDKWVDIDAALRQTDCDPTHIAVSLMPLSGDGMMNSVMSLIPLLGQLEIEVLKVVE